MERKIIGLVGFAGSGKNTAGNYLISQHGFRQLSFAGPLKDIASLMFGWPRAMVEGDTKESRNWREIPDKWWSNALGWEVTPRLVLQLLGTESGRNVFGENLWSSIVLNKIQNIYPNDDIVVIDCRFVNEIQSLTNIGGKVYHIEREKPIWFDVAYDERKNCNGGQMAAKFPKIHVSEWDWLQFYDEIPIIKNDGTINDLYEKVEEKVLS